MHGAGLREIADILGHKTLAMVQRYSHLTQDHKASVVDRMTDAIFQDDNTASK
jgi:site-specific recombinase XerD